MFHKCLKEQEAFVKSVSSSANFSVLTGKPLNRTKK